MPNKLKNLVVAMSATLAIAFALAACAPISSTSGTSAGGAPVSSGKEIEISIKLPHIFASSQSSRSIAPDDLPELQAATKSFRVKFTSNYKTVVREVSTDTTDIQAAFYVGTDVSVTVECLNESGEVIVRTEPKTIKVRSSNNTISFKLSEDGTKIVPEPEPEPEPDPEPEPEPQPEPSAYKVTYNGGAADAQGVPSDSNEYETDALVTLATAEPTRNGFTFMGWTANVALTGNSRGGPEQISIGQTFVSLSSNVNADYNIRNFSMPEGGVTLTAKWESSSPTAYSVTYNGGADDAQDVPNDSATYETGAIVSLDTNEPTRSGFTFMGWTANVALTGNGNGQVQISSGKTFVYPNSAVIADYEINNFSMPEGGVTLTAQWISSSYNMIEIDSPEKLQKYATKMKAGNQVTYPNGQSVAANRASYKLTKDLDLTGMSGIVLSSNNYQFAGDFDGNGHKISNLSGNDGLFHDVESAGIIRNLILESVKINTSGYNQSSPFALTMNGKLIGCQVSGTITSSNSKYALAKGSGSVAGCLSLIDSRSVNALCQVNSEMGAAFATDSTDVDTLNTEISNWNSLPNTQSDPRLKCDWHFEKNGTLTLVRGAPTQP